MTSPLRGLSRWAVRGAATLCAGLVFTLLPATRAEHESADVTYEMLQAVTEQENPLIGEPDLLSRQGKKAIEAIVASELSGDVDFSRPDIGDVRSFDAFLDRQLLLNYPKKSQRCGTRRCYPPPDSLDELIALAGHITSDYMAYDHDAHLIERTHRTVAISDRAKLGVSGHIAAVMLATGGAAAEYVRLSSMDADGIRQYGRGLCTQYSLLYSAVLVRLNEKLGSPFNISVGRIFSNPLFSREEDPVYRALVRLTNLYLFDRWNDRMFHSTNVVISYEEDAPRLMFIDAQSPTFVDNSEQTVRIDRRAFSYYAPYLDLADRFNVVTYAAAHRQDESVYLGLSDRGLYSDIVLDDGSARILTEEIGVREDIMRYTRRMITPSSLSFAEIHHLRRYHGGPSDGEMRLYIQQMPRITLRMQTRRMRENPLGLPPMSQPSDAGVDGQ